ncbi:MAG: hypothetical protein OMM_10854 [Candidatus Magnetoglobus multicellularis str. Araruama]|uniref:Single-stranded DNA-binding protein n=1 Tax=Candidatus Magnetoglobus multicellularis str. Araruama TaxID=890399 RepID=A0A1V1P008_9BACT|nr:MAG: hypothetical protein OMM_10854 [Candidatus Magnetoglobus multicellularis str. Araruama]
MLKFKKGEGVVVEGRIQSRTYTTEDGQTRWVTEVLAFSSFPTGLLPEIEYIPAQEMSTAVESNKNTESETSTPAGANFDDIPF